MSQFTDGNAPGMTTLIETVEAQVWWSGPDKETMRAETKINLLAANVDAGNTPTSTLRGGNILAIEDGTDNAYLYDKDGENGLQVASGVLQDAQNMNVRGTSTNRFTSMLVHGLLKGNSLVTGTQIGAIDEQAKAQLIRRGFQWDGKQPEGAAFLVHAKGAYQKAADYTVTAADNGKLFISEDAGDIEFTLPTIAPGLSYEFFQSIDDEMVITGSNNIAGLNGLAFSAVTFTTDGQQIGAHVSVRAEYIGISGTQTLKWIVTHLHGPGYTVAYSG